MRTSQPDFEDGTLNAYNIQGNEIQNGDRFGYKIVLVVGKATFCAYRGPTSWTDSQVASNGDEIRRAAVESLFPTILWTLEAQGYTYGG